MFEDIITFLVIGLSRSWNFILSSGGLVLLIGILVGYVFREKIYWLRNALVWSFLTILILVLAIGFFNIQFPNFSLTQVTSSIPTFPEGTPQPSNPPQVTPSLTPSVSVTPPLATYVPAP